MPTVRARIRKRDGKQVKQWQVMVRLQGYPHSSKIFPEGTSERDAYEWGLEQERKLKLGDVPTLRRKEWQNVTILSLIQDYRQDRLIHIHNRKRSYDNEDIMLDAFLGRVLINSRCPLCPQ
jgi:hypothetical protein